MAVTLASSTLGTINQLTLNQRNQQLTLGQMSSGQRITSAAIDPANVSILAELGFLDVSTRQAVSNTNVGMSVVQTAEGGASSISDTLSRMREIAVAASSETISESQREALQDEYDQLASEIERVAVATEFDGQELISGGASDIDVQVGVTSGAESQVTIAAADLTLGGLGLSSTDLSSADAARSALDDIDAAQEAVSSARSDYGATQNRLGSAISSSTSSLEANAAAASSIGDSDYAEMVSRQSSEQLQQQASLAVLVQTANINRTAVLGLIG